MKKKNITKISKFNWKIVERCKINTRHDSSVSLIDTEEKFKNPKGISIKSGEIKLVICAQIPTSYKLYKFWFVNGFFSEIEIRLL
jgi:hypothetical protein